MTGLDVVPLLRASHIKPWASCESDDERLDVFNGLLLAPHVDALFDDGWIAWNDDGTVLISDALPVSAAACLGVAAGWRIAGLRPAHRKYLAFHHRCVFRSGTPRHQG